MHKFSSTFRPLFVTLSLFDHKNSFLVATCHHGRNQHYSPPDLIHSAQLADSQPSIPLATSAPCVPACSSKVDDDTSKLDDPSDFDESSDRGGSLVLDHDDSPKLGISQAAIPLLKTAPHVFIKSSEFVGSQTAIALATLPLSKTSTTSLTISNIRTTPMKVDAEGIKALITSSLKSWIMTHDYGARFYFSHDYSGLISLPGPFPDINNVWFGALLELYVQLTVVKLTGECADFDQNLFKEFLASGVNLEVLDLSEGLGGELGLEELIQIMRMPKLKSFCSSRVLGFTPEIVDMVVQRLGSHHSMPHLRKLDYLWCHSGSVSAAPRLLPMMPGLEKLRLDLDDHFSSTWNNAIDFVIFPILATLKNLQELRMLCKAEWQLDGKHLLELTCLDDLEVLIIHMRPGVPCSFTMEGAQFASLLRGLPKLRSLRLGVGSCFVSASREDFDYINEAVSRIEDVDLESITLVHDESLDTESGSQ
ncbi:hypothetical protein E4T42_00747 [Aureobasidium subglaciale]|nr:hypothetical protein E4T42_00747 [Aureobasidium subglaciale]